MRNEQILILGAGISGLGAALGLKKKGFSSVILEKDSSYGGLCNNFTINGFRFDRFVHFSHTENDFVNHLFLDHHPDVIRHAPNAYNLYKRLWIKHPAQNNIYKLSADEKNLIIEDFKKRPTQVTEGDIDNYESWLRVQYGDYFAEHFPMVYTRKYWMEEAKNLRTEWVGVRCYQPSLDEVILGSETEKTPVAYYAKEMRYPARGGFKSFLDDLVQDANIKYNKEIRRIDAEKKIVSCEDGSSYGYHRLVSSLPLPEIIKMLEDVPEEVKKAAMGLRCTSGYLISIGLKTKNIPPYLWWYIYDEDILPARVYSPSLKSPDNAPEGCSSLQMELYCEENQYTKEDMIQKSVDKLVDSKFIKKEDILFVDIRFEKYANVIFDQHIYENRKVVRDYLQSVGIETIGRFGEWDYLWTDQSLLSGFEVEI